MKFQICSRHRQVELHLVAHDLRQLGIARGPRIVVTGSPGMRWTSEARNVMTTSTTNAVIARRLRM